MFFLCLFALIIGLIKSIAAPVVPIQLASRVPIRIISRLTIGVPTNVPVSLTPPEIVNRASNKIINGKYSNSPTCRSSYKVIETPSLIRKGIIKIEAQNSDTFPKLWCQNSGRTSGKIAIDSNIPANGTTQIILMFSMLPSK